MSDPTTTPELPLKTPKKVTIVTCGICGERRPNKGRGLCAEHYRSEDKSGRIGWWMLDKTDPTNWIGRRVTPLLDPAPAQIAATTPDPGALVIAVGFGGRDVPLYRKVIDEAARTRRTVEAQVLHYIDLALAEPPTEVAP